MNLNIIKELNGEQIHLRGFNLENKSLGLSLTASEGFNMRRVCIELTDTKDIEKLRDYFDYILKEIV